MAAERPLVELAGRLDVNRLRDFVQIAGSLDTELLRSSYRQESAHAPDRSVRGKRYLVGHTGIPGTGEATTRLEEHLAIALFNEYRHTPLDVPSGSIRILDYQVPLKARRADAGVGKIDLLGARPTGRTCVMELKVVGNTGQPDTPLRALMEGLAYAAILQPNLSAIQTETGRSGDDSLTLETPDLVVLGPSSYWDFFRTRPKLEGWEQTLGDLLGRVRDATGCSAEFVELSGFEFKPGIAGTKPRITKAGRCHTLISQADRS